MALLLDANVWIAAVSPRQRYHREAEALVESSAPVTVLDLTLYEVANAIGVRSRAPERAANVFATILTRCGGQLHRVDPDLMNAAIELSAEHGITAYDAAYVAAARRHDWTLVSADIKDLVAKGLAVAPEAAV